MGEGRAARRTTVTVSDVARHAGVSTAVVSYVINGGPRPVSARSAARVRQAIAELDYRPNLSARALRRGSSELLGFILPDASNPYFADLGRALRAAAEVEGLGVLLADSDTDQERERAIVRWFVARQVDGLVAASNFAEPDFTAATDGGIRTVLLGRRTAPPGVFSIASDFVDGAAAGTRHLIEHGHSAIGLLIGEDSTGGAFDREAGWAEAMRTAGLGPGPLIRCRWNREHGYRAALDLLGRDERPTAVLAGSDVLAISVLRAAHELGLRVPEDVALVTFDGSSAADYTVPSLTSVTQDTAALARDAVSWIVGGSAELGTDPFERRPVPTSLTIRESCGRH